MKQIPLTQGKFALVDDDMFDYLSQWKWYAKLYRDIWYAERTDYSGLRKKSFQMHRVIMNAPDGVLVDHRNGDGLYNTRENLRVCTHAQNMFNKKKYANNTSGYKGVSFRKTAKKKKWQAYITSSGVTVHLGYFSDEEDAARAYDAKARELHGEFARTNF